MGFGQSVSGQWLVSKFMIIDDADNIRLLVLDNGRMHLHQHDLDGTLTEQLTSADKLVKIPIYCVLIYHPDGLVLFDAGCHPDAMKPGGRWPSKLQASCPWTFDQRDLLLNRLIEQGVKSDEIRYVVCSHLHCDHAGNLEFFSKSKILVHANEWQAAQNEYKIGVHSGEFVRDDMTAWMRAGLDIELVSPDTSSFTLLPGITVHNLGRGHSYGMLVLEVELADTGTVILASDAAFNEVYYRQQRSAPKLSVDAVGYLNGIQTIEYLARKKHAQVWLGHDMRQFSELQKINAGWWL